MCSYHLKNEEEMKRFGELLGRELEANMVLTLNGELGTGKTTLTKAIAWSMGVTDHVVSPTFTIVLEYEGKRFPLYHFDAYRIAEEEEMYFIGFEEYLTKGGICIIEWAQLICGLLPEERLNVEISYCLSGGREVRLFPRGKRYEIIAEKIKEHFS